MHHCCCQQKEEYNLIREVYAELASTDCEECLDGLAEEAVVMSCWQGWDTNCMGANAVVALNHTVGTVRCNHDCPSGWGILADPWLREEDGSVELLALLVFAHAGQLIVSSCG